ncbi:hypothetical protein L7F22_058940 [Adiantum nelumboides]|nr:hypothetical protein [Adiantum nelumboides]
MSTSSVSGLCYMLVLVDDFSRYTWVSFLRLKSEAFGSIRDWKAMVQKEKNLKVKSICSNRGGEFLSENFARWCKSEGIRRQLTTPYTPYQNGVVERKNRTIMEMARAMLAHASLPRSYWTEACNTTVYIQNRSPTHALQDMTPFQAYYGRKPTVSHFPESDAYRLYDPDIRTTTVSRDVVFDESFITFAKGAAAHPIPILPPPSLPDPPASPVITPLTSHPVPPIQPPDVSPDHALSDFDSHLDVADATPEVDLAPPRREKRIPGWLYSTVASSGVTELPVPPPAGLPRHLHNDVTSPDAAYTIELLARKLQEAMTNLALQDVVHTQLQERQLLVHILKENSPSKSQHRDSKRGNSNEKKKNSAATIRGQISCCEEKARNKTKDIREKSNVYDDDTTLTSDLDVHPRRRRRIHSPSAPYGRKPSSSPSSHRSEESEKKRRKKKPSSSPPSQTSSETESSSSSNSNFIKAHKRKGH